MLWLKFTHIAALAFWMGALFYLPALLSAHRRINDQQDFARLRMSSRFVFMFIASPAACIAVVSGTALLFFTDVRHPWMLAKLAGVGLLAICHYRFGSLLTRFAAEGQEPPAYKGRVIVVLAACAASAALWLVLAKPSFGAGPMPAWMTEPSGLLSSRLPPDRSE
ncbi:MAG: CopD family protein [Hyphomonas sp.]